MTNATMESLTAGILKLMKENPFSSEGACEEQKNRAIGYGLALEDAFMLVCEVSMNECVAAGADPVKAREYISALNRNRTIRRMLGLPIGTQGATLVS